MKPELKKRLEEMGLPPEAAAEVSELLNKEIKELKEAHKEEIYRIRLEGAIERAVRASGAKTGKAVEALLDLSKISINENGEVTGIAEQLKALKENEATEYLFNNEESSISFKGVQIGTSFTEEKTIEDMSYDEICAYLEGN